MVFIYKFCKKKLFLYNHQENLKNKDYVKFDKKLELHRETGIIF